MCVYVCVCGRGGEAWLVVKVLVAGGLKYVADIGGRVLIIIVFIIRSFTTA